MGDSVALSFYDVCLYKSDVDLLDGSFWINDSVISFTFEYFRRVKFVRLSKEVAFVSPDVVQLAKFADAESMKSAIAPLNLPEFRLVLLPVNDNSSSAHWGGTHWSLLAYERTTNHFYHYDSSGTEGNLKSAKHVATCLQQSLCSKTSDFDISPNCDECEIISVNCARQSNGYDCGIYTLIFADLLAQRLDEEGALYLFDWDHRDNLHNVTLADVSDYRFSLSMIIKHLK